MVRMERLPTAGIEDKIANNRDHRQNDDGPEQVAADFFAVEWRLEPTSRHCGEMRPGRDSSGKIAGFPAVCPVIRIFEPETADGHRITRVDSSVAQVESRKMTRYTLI